MWYNSTKILMKNIDGATQDEEERFLAAFETAYNLRSRKNPEYHIDKLKMLYYKLKKKYNYEKTDKDIINQS